MNDEQTVRLGPWYGLVCFGGGSILTVAISTLDSGRGPLSGIQPFTGLTVLFWAVLGAVTGGYILMGRGWRALERAPRVRLAAAFFALVWASLFAMMMTTPAAAGLIVLLGIAAAIVFIAHGLEQRPRNQDGGEIFP